MEQLLNVQRPNTLRFNSEGSKMIHSLWLHSCTKSPLAFWPKKQQHIISKKQIIFVNIISEKKPSDKFCVVNIAH